MTQQEKQQPDPKEVAKEVEEFVRNTPSEVLVRMRLMQEGRRQVHSPSSVGGLMTKRQR